MDLKKEWEKWHEMTLSQLKVIRRMVAINDAVILRIDPQVDGSVVIGYRYQADTVEILRQIQPNGEWEYFEGGIKRG